MVRHGVGQLVRSWERIRYLGDTNEIRIFGRKGNEERLLVKAGASSRSPGTNNPPKFDSVDV